MNISDSTLTELSTELDHIYTPLEEAKEELLRRWNDHNLRYKVSSILKDDIPDPFRTAPRATLARFILSPNFELYHFLDLIRDTGLKPLCLEYLNDKFVSENIDKYYLCKLFFHGGTGKKGGDRLSALNVIDFNGSEGKRICDLHTVYDKKLIDFHREVMDYSCIDSDIDRFDISDHYNRNGKVSKHYYTYFLSLFVRNGILFENFLLDKIQVNITRDVVLPAYANVCEKFGVKPLIVRLGPIGREESLYWRYYPNQIKERIHERFRLDK